MKAGESGTPKLVPYRKWPDHFCYPSVGTLKYLLLRRKDNGFDVCVRVINNRIYLDTEKTFQWFNNKGETR